MSRAASASLLPKPAIEMKNPVNNRVKKVTVVMIFRLSIGSPLNVFNMPGNAVAVAIAATVAAIRRHSGHHAPIMLF